MFNKLHEENDQHIILFFRLVVFAKDDMHIQTINEKTLKERFSSTRVEKFTSVKHQNSKRRGTKWVNIKVVIHNRRRGLRNLAFLTFPKYMVAQ